ncbi:hypothetical protein CF336_g4358 [Tilletia laevis]|nr:hypothetical protein CF336_g4358 [Tilletia laevis]
MSSTTIDIKALKARYTAAGQAHLFKYWDKLTSAQQTTLASQLASIDVERVNAVYKTATQAEANAKSSSSSAAENKILPPPKDSLLDTAPGSSGLQSARQAGLHAIAQGKVALVLMAGGQGTRLGSSAPKGTYDIELPSHKSLFQLQAERIIRLTQLAEQTTATQFEEKASDVHNDDSSNGKTQAVPVSALMAREARSIPRSPLGGGQHCVGGCPPPQRRTVPVVPLGGGQYCVGGCPPPGLRIIETPSPEAIASASDSSLLRPAKKQRTLSVGASAVDAESLVSFTPATSYTWSDQGHNDHIAAAGVPWFIMTSKLTHQPTIDFFNKHNFFGLHPADVVFFQQGSLPCLTEDGKIMLSPNGAVATAPGGEGAFYSALRAPLEAGSSDTPLSLMRFCGIEYIHLCGIDNSLVRVADPVFVGGCIERDAKVGIKVVNTTSLAESVFYSLDFLETEVPQFEEQMAFHITREMIPTLAPNASTGELEPITPTMPNGMKLELYISDVLPFVDPVRLAVQEVSRQEEFSPLKNGKGAESDSPETSRRDLLALQKTWLQSVEGVEVAEGIEVEISPLISYAGDGLEQYKGRKFTEDTVIEV